MSKIKELGSKLDKLPDMLEEYEDALVGVEDILAIKGKSIGKANRESANQFFYETRKAELEALTSLLESKVNSTRSALFRNLTEKSPRELSDRAKEKYIDGEAKFLTMNEIYLEVKEMYDKYRAACDSFKNRGYALNNITRATIVSVEENIIE